MKDYKHRSDEQLLASIREGDRLAFHEIYYRYWKKLYGSAYPLLNDSALCEDLVQDLFITLWVKREKWQIESLQAYLYTALRNRVFKALKKQKIQVDSSSALQYFPSDYAADRDVLLKEINSLRDQGIRQLPERCRLIYRMSREEALSTKEIALKLNLAPKTVENQMTIALRRLRGTLHDFLV